MGGKVYDRQPLVVDKDPTRQLAVEVGKLKMPNPIDMLGHWVGQVRDFILKAIKQVTGIDLTGWAEFMDALPGFDASKIISGIISGIRIPLLDASKIISGVFDAVMIPFLDAGKILTGIFHGGRIPGIDASKIVSGQFAQDMVNGLQSGLSNLGNGIQGIVNGVVNSIRGAVGDFWSQAEANSALASQASATAAIAAALEQIRAGNNNNNTGGLNVVVDFSEYPDSIHLPAPAFTTTYAGGSGSYGVSDGLARATQAPGFFETREIFGEYVLADTVTDYQRVSAVWTSGPAYSYQNPTPAFTPLPFYNAYWAEITIYCRYKDPLNWVRARFNPQGNNGRAWLECCVNGTITVFVQWDHDFQANTAYILEAGTFGNLRTYRLFLGSKVIKTHTDNANVSQVGADFKGSAVGGIMRGAQGAGVPVTPGRLLYFGVQDNSPAGVVGSGARVYRANTGSQSVNGATPNSFFDTIESLTSEYTYNALAGCRITVSVTDWYVVSARLAFPSGSNNQVGLWKNGVQIRTAGGSAGILASLGTWVVYLQAGDYVQAGMSSSTSARGSADGINSYIEITRVGKATVEVAA